MTLFSPGKMVAVMNGLKHWDGRSISIPFTLGTNKATQCHQIHFDWTAWGSAEGEIAPSQNYSNVTVLTLTLIALIVGSSAESLTEHFHLAPPILAI